MWPPRSAGRLHGGERTEARRRHACAVGSGLWHRRARVTPTGARDVRHVFHQYTVRVTGDARMDRDQLAAAFGRTGIGSGSAGGRPTATTAAARTRRGSSNRCEAGQTRPKILSLPVQATGTQDRIGDVVHLLGWGPPTGGSATDRPRPRRILRHRCSMRVGDTARWERSGWWVLGGRGEGVIRSITMRSRHRHGPAVRAKASPRSAGQAPVRTAPSTLVEVVLGGMDLGAEAMDAPRMRGDPGSGRSSGASIIARSTPGAAAAARSEPAIIVAACPSWERIWRWRPRWCAGEVQQVAVQARRSNRRAVPSGSSQLWVSSPFQPCCGTIVMAGDGVRMECHHRWNLPRAVPT